MTAHPLLSLFVLFITSEILETPKSTKLVSQITDNTAARQRKSSPCRKSGADPAAHTWTHKWIRSNSHTCTHTHTHNLCVI